MCVCVCVCVCVYVCLCVCIYMQMKKNIKLLSVHTNKILTLLALLLLTRPYHMYVDIVMDEADLMGDAVVVHDVRAA